MCDPCLCCVATCVAARELCVFDLDIRCVPGLCTYDVCTNVLNAGAWTSSHAMCSAGVADVGLYRFCISLVMEAVPLHAGLHRMVAMVPVDFLVALLLQLKCSALKLMRTRVVPPACISTACSAYLGEACLKGSPCVCSRFHRGL